MRLLILGFEMLRKSISSQKAVVIAVLTVIALVVSFCTAQLLEDKTGTNQSKEAKEFTIEETPWKRANDFDESALSDDIRLLIESYGHLQTNIPRGYDQNTYIKLIRVGYRNPNKVLGAQSLEGYLYFDNATLDNVIVYQVDRNGSHSPSEGNNNLWKKLYHYKLQDITTHPVDYRKPVFPVAVSLNEPVELVLVVRGNSSLSLEFGFTDRTKFWQGEAYSNGIYMLFFGMLVVMILYHLALSFFTSYHDYSLYAVYIFFNLLLQMSLSGHIKYYGITNSDFLLDNGQMTFAAATCFSGGLFLLRLLDVKKLSGFLFKVSCVILCSWLVVFILSFIYSEASLAYFHVPLSCISFFFVMAVAVIAHRSGNKLARPFIFAWLALIVGGVIFVLRVAGIVPINNFTIFSLHIGITIEIILLSMVLAVRIKLLKEDSLQELVRLKNNFLGTVSHELRTPINGIAGNAELLEQENHDPETMSKIRDIGQSANGIMKVIDNILVYSELHAGQLIRNDEVFDISKLLSSLEESFREKADEKGIRFNFELYRDMPKLVFGDEKRLYQILVTILDNALQYTDKGSISVFCYALPRNDEISDFLFIVQDTGKGIEPELSEEIFNFFNQGDNSYQRAHGGLGIGLAIGKKLTELLGGKIEFTSDVGVGTTFVVNLPLVVTSDVEETANESVQVLTSKPRTLIVEDNHVNQKILKAMLKKLDLPADIASNGKEAVDLCSNAHYDLIFMDCQMPIMDGFEATIRIRSLKDFQDTVIIAVTANATAHDQDACIQSGMNDHLAKPVKLDQLKSAIARYLTYPE